MFNFTVKGTQSMSYTFNASAGTPIPPELAATSIPRADPTAPRSWELLTHPTPSEPATGALLITCVYDAFGRTVSTQ